MGACWGEEGEEGEEGEDGEDGCGGLVCQGWVIDEERRGWKRGGGGVGIM